HPPPLRAPALAACRTHVSLHLLCRSASRPLSSPALFFFFNVPATTEIYTLSLHDALPICLRHGDAGTAGARLKALLLALAVWLRSEEHTSELQSLTNLVCRLLLEKKKNQHIQ